MAASVAAEKIDRAQLTSAAWIAHRIKRTMSTVGPEDMKWATSLCWSGFEKLRINTRPLSTFVVSRQILELFSKVVRLLARLRSKCASRELTILGPQKL